MLRPVCWLIRQTLSSAFGFFMQCLSCAACLSALLQHIANGTGCRAIET